MAEGMTIPKWSVGVVVPACNEESTIEACIDSTFTALDSCSTMESSWIVVVADSCDDRTVERARARLGDRGEVIEYAELSLYIRQCHAERDLETIPR
jgi:glycosyltransferase involved in cell wall biosynthesis